MENSLEKPFKYGKMILSLTPGGFYTPVDVMDWVKCRKVWDLHPSQSDSVETSAKHNCTLKKHHSYFAKNCQGNAATDGMQKWAGSWRGHPSACPF